MLNIPLVKSAVTVALFNIRSNISRSIIIVFSIFLGIASVLVMISLIRGMKKQFEEAMEYNGGYKVIFIEAVKPKNRLEELQFSRSPGLMPLQIEKAVREIDLIDFAVPRYQFRGGTTVSYNQKSLGCHCVALDHNYFKLYARKNLTQGRFISREDDENKNKVCLINDKIMRGFFKDGNWQGKRIVFENVALEVIGVLGGPGSERFPPMMFFPLSVYWQYISSRNKPIPKCEFVAKRVDQVTETKKAVEEFLIREHRGVKDFWIESSVEAEEMILKQQAAMKILIIGIGLAALIIGAIGITNIMLSTMNENIRDIGILKTIGASNVEVFIQSLTETVILALAGAILGSIGGSLLVLMPDQQLPWGKAILVWYDYVYTVAIACAAGIVSGFMPALFAARLSPAEAIGYRI